MIAQKGRAGQKGRVPGPVGHCPCPDDKRWAHRPLIQICHQGKVHLPPKGCMRYYYGMRTLPRCPLSLDNIRAFLSRAIVVLVFLCALPTPCVALSAEELTYITEEYPPYSYTKDGEPTGFAVEVLRLMWKEMRVAPQPIRMQPWARGMHTLEHEPHIMLFTAGWSLDRAEKFHFIRPLLSNESSALALKSKNIVISSITDMQRYKVGTVRSDLREKVLLDAGFPEKELQRVATINTSAKMLAYGRIDLMVGGTGTMLHALEEEGFAPDDFEVVYVIAYFENGYMLSRDVPDALVRRFQNALDAVRETPEFDVLVKKYSLQRVDGSR